MIKCPYCQSERRQVKAGFNSCGTQLYRCQVCKRRYSPHPKDPGYPQEVRQMAIELYMDGHSFRSVGRLLEVNYQTVINWVDDFISSFPDLFRSRKVQQVGQKSSFFRD